MKQRSIGIPGEATEHREETVCIRNKLILLDKPTSLIGEGGLIL